MKNEKWKISINFLIPIRFCPSSWHITGQIGWQNGTCYHYDLEKVPNCKTELKLSNNTIFCEDDKFEDSFDDDYTLHSTLSVETEKYGVRPQVMLDKQTICEILQIC